MKTKILNALLALATLAASAAPALADGFTPSTIVAPPAVNAPVAPTAPQEISPDEVAAKAQWCQYQYQYVCNAFGCAYQYVYVCF